MCPLKVGCLAVVEDSVEVVRTVGPWFSHCSYVHYLDHARSILPIQKMLTKFPGVGGFHWAYVIRVLLWAPNLCSIPSLVYWSLLGTGIGLLTNSLRSFSRLLSHMDSRATTVVPLYSTLVLDRSTVGCFLLLQKIVPLCNENINPEVDLLLDLLHAQSVSTNPSSRSYTPRL